MTITICDEKNIHQGNPHIYNNAKMQYNYILIYVLKLQLFYNELMALK